MITTASRTDERVRRLVRRRTLCARIVDALAERDGTVESLPALAARAVLGEIDSELRRLGRASNEA